MHANKTHHYFTTVSTMPNCEHVNRYCWYETK